MRPIGAVISRSSMQVVLLLLLLLIGSNGNGGGSLGAAAEPLSSLDSYAGYLDVLKSPELLASAKTYQTLFAHKHKLSQGQLDRALVYKGANLRMRRVLNKLLAGKAVSIGVIGGSISWGHAVKKGEEDWFSLFSAWMNATFPQSKLTAKNGCVPATLSEYVSMCLKQFVNEDVDLVFVEYATNDGYHDGSVNNGPVQSFERLLRKLLNFPNGPAVALMEFLATGVKINKVPFWATAEDQYGVLSQYYGLPWLSYRNVVWQGLMAGTPGFSRQELFPVEEQEERHPTALGHRYLADMAVHLVQQTYLDSLLAPVEESMLHQHTLSKVPEPMFKGNYESGNLVCIIGQQLPAVVVQNNGFNWTNEGTAEKPKWGFVSWQVGATLLLKVDTRASVPINSRSIGGAQTMTAAAAAAAAAAAEPLAKAAAPGALVAESAGLAASGAEAISSSLKNGLAGSAASTAEEVAADGSSSSSSSSAAGGGGEPAAAADMIIWVGYLKSWQNMGTASMSCISGCSCAPVTVDGMHELGNTQQFMAKMFATQAEECLVEVKINEWARQQYHKFKVTGIMVTRHIKYHNYGDFTDSVLLDALTN